MMHVYYKFYRREGNVGERRGGGKASSVCTLEREESPSERGRVVRERDRVLARRLAVAVRAAGSPFVDGPEHDAAHLSVDVGDDGLLVLDATMAVGACA